MLRRKNQRQTNELKIQRSNPERPSSRRGFAAMDPEQQREIARAGGRAAHARGTAHEFTSEEARAAGKKGGEISRRGRKKLND